MLHPLRPGHFADVDQSFDTLLELNEGAVVGHADHSSADVSPDRVAMFGIKPGIRRELLEAERHALLVFVELEDFDLNLIADIDQVARMSKASPRHVGDVQ